MSFRQRKITEGAYAQLRCTFCYFCFVLASILSAWQQNRYILLAAGAFLYQDAYDQYTGILEIFLDWLKSGEKKERFYGNVVLVWI